MVNMNEFYLIDNFLDKKKYILYICTVQSFTQHKITHNMFIIKQFMFFLIITDEYYLCNRWYNIKTRYL
jgi:hypothetical protein